jgi:LysM repeat protein
MQKIRKPIVVVILVFMLVMLTVPAAFASGGRYHKVHRGETLYSIGRSYGVNPYDIARANNLRNANYIYAGQTLYIPTHSGPGQGSNYHTVRYGETLTSIAYRYGVSTWAIAKHNNLYNLNHIYAGQKLYIPSGY